MLKAHCLRCSPDSYNAGSCLPLFAPSGCRKHTLAVKLEILDELFPQYLHSYLGLSVPSYKVCLPLLGPLGWRKQTLAVKLEMLDAVVPQYLQCGIIFMLFCMQEP